MQLMVRLVAVALGALATRGAFEVFGGDGWSALLTVVGVPFAGGVVYAAVVTAGEQLLALPKPYDTTR